MTAAPTSPAPRSTRFRRGAALALALLAGGAANPAAAQPEGTLEVRSAATVLIGGVWYLSARLDCRLGRAQAEALRKGVPLRLRVEVELDRSRPYWPDASLTRLGRDSELVYQALTGQYLVRDVATDERQYFNSLFAALEAVGEVRRLALVDDAALEPGAQYVGRLRVVLDPEGLSMRRPVLGFPRPGPALVSDWYPWSLPR
jgi:hypothetical protein